MDLILVNLKIFLRHYIIIITVSETWFHHLSTHRGAISLNINLQGVLSFQISGESGIDFVKGGDKFPGGCEFVAIF